MDDVPPAPAIPVGPDRVGDILRAAREKMGLSLAEVAARTRVPLRHLEAIEIDDYAGLPSPTYATGFAKAYARVVGADEVMVARRVRGELAGVTRVTPEYQPYEATDPMRLPSRGVTIVALGLAVGLLILAGLYFGTGLFRRGLAPATPDVAVAQPAADAPPPAPTPTPAATGGQVYVTATDEVWVRIYEADGKTLHQGTLQPGERFDVPADAREPMINVGRPDKISITINGSQVQGLDLGSDPIKDVRVSAAALAARASGVPEPSPTPPAVSTADAPARGRAAPAGRARQRAERPRATTPLTETQRANLDAARNVGDAR